MKNELTLNLYNNAVSKRLERNTSIHEIYSESRTHVMGDLHQNLKILRLMRLLVIGMLFIIFFLNHILFQANVSWYKVIANVSRCNAEN